MRAALTPHALPGTPLNRSCCRRGTEKRLCQPRHGKPGPSRPRAGAFHVALVPWQRAMLTLQVSRDPSGGRSHGWDQGSATRGCRRQDSIPGHRGKGTLLGGSAEVTNQQRRRLSTSSPSRHSVPLPAPSGEIYRLSKRSEMKATAPAARWPRWEERASLPSSSPPAWLHLGEQDTHWCLPAKSSSISP